MAAPSFPKSYADFMATANAVRIPVAIRASWARAANDLPNSSFCLIAPSMPPFAPIVERRPRNVRCISLNFCCWSANSFWRSICCLMLACEFLKASVSEDRSKAFLLRRDSYWARFRASTEAFASSSTFFPANIALIRILISSDAPVGILLFWPLR